KIGVSVRHIFKPISYLEIQLLSGVSGGYITSRSSLTADMAKTLSSETDATRPSSPLKDFALLP
ncbi:hypothetical protein, partial [Enterobacter hormaechei]|uniref:hypothetical protein n=1 Tax=Enterobacter hormaechei TaxID=158836 RepID=UPI001C556D3D